MPWQATSARVLLEEETPEGLEARNQREIAQARLDWQTRQGNSLTQTLRWQRFYRKHPHSRKSMEQIERELTARVSVLTEMAEKPARYTSGAAWTRCMERLEDVTAELGVVRACLKDGGS
jgi:hypothetical protein